MRRDKGLRYYLFDLLFLNGEDLREQSLLERKNKLRDLLQKTSKHLFYSEHLSTRGEDFYALSCQHNLEGVVSKMSSSSYRSGRSDVWKKTKCGHRQEFVVGGFTKAKGARNNFGALLLGVYDDGKLRYAGKVGTGFTQADLREMKKLLKPLVQPETPFEIHSPAKRSLHWVEPIKVVEVSFAQWTDEGLLRAPVFQGLREDKPAREIGMEKANSSSVLSSPDKVLFKEEGITKKLIADYYRKVAKFMLPQIKDRPLSLVRCPSGTEKKCFYQKHMTGTMPDSLVTFPVEEDKGTGIYFSIHNAQGLLDLVQLNAFEVHAWNCHYQKLLRPDQIVMDLDPGPGVVWKDVVKGAFELKKLLEKLGLKSFAKVTGGKGIHVHVPIAPIYDWDQVKTFSQTIALQLVSTHPEMFVANMSKKVRKGKIFLDYLRNGYGATAVVPYSLRAKSTSSVALPLEWSELRRLRSGGDFTLSKALKKIHSRKKDPWAAMKKLKQKIRILKSADQ